MIDWHTHILPGMDDGSKSVEESIEMLIAEKRQGVDRVILTSHYYAFDEAGEVFLERRKKSLEKLKQGIVEYTEGKEIAVSDFPEMLPAAEIYLYDRLHKMECLEELCFLCKKRKHVLIEMPFDSWTDRNINEVYMTAGACGGIPVMAHVERYLKYKGNEDKLSELVNMGAVLQFNSEYFEGRLNRMKAAKIIKKLGANYVLGTDCHNMKSRKPDWTGAMKFVL